jgi:hypothetical protein
MFSYPWPQPWYQPPPPNPFLNMQTPFGSAWWNASKSKTNMPGQTPRNPDGSRNMDTSSVERRIIEDMLTTIPRTEGIAMVQTLCRFELEIGRRSMEIITRHHPYYQYQNSPIHSGLNLADAWIVEFSNFITGKIRYEEFAKWWSVNHTLWFAMRDWLTTTAQEAEINKTMYRNTYTQ